MNVNQRRLIGYEKKRKQTRIQERIRNLKQNKELDNKRKLYLHNYRLKFPLTKQCKIPFSKNLLAVKLHNNIQYILATSSFSLRQTSKNLIVYPKFKSIAAKPGNPQEIAAIMRAYCFAIVKKLQAKYIGLKVFKPQDRPCQEFAVKDDFASRLDFTFANDLGKFDKSVRVDSDGFKVTGGEIEYFTPEMADLYLRMPLLFKDMADTFSKSLVNYNANIELHLSVLKDMQRSLRLMRPKGLRMPSSFGKSATVRGVV